jgi:hypothetical protein
MPLNAKFVQLDLKNSRFKYRSSLITSALRSELKSSFPEEMLRQQRRYESRTPTRLGRYV